MRNCRSIPNVLLSFGNLIDFHHLEEEKNIDLILTRNEGVVIEFLKILLLDNVEYTRMELVNIALLMLVS